jgi:hypothetical protein
VTKSFSLPSCPAPLHLGARGFWGMTKFALLRSGDITTWGILGVLVAVLLVGCIDKKSVRQAWHVAILKESIEEGSYVKDSRTNICFITFFHNRRTITSVPCTKEVEKQIQKQQRVK